jgi:glycosyltransferase involved in cell wall biosynthesis
LLLEAFARVGARHGTARLALIGDGELRGELESLAESLGIRDRVHFAGEQRAIAPLVADLDIFVLCSISEGTSISLLEALASGIPCVATAVGGNLAVLDQGNAGVLVPSDDVAALAQALDDLLASPEARRDLADRGRAHALAAYSEEAMTRAYEAVYERALAVRR